jgi:chromosome partitioning protein
MNNAIEQLDDILSLSESFIKVMHELASAPNPDKSLRLFSTGDTARMVGRDRSTIQKAEAVGVIDAPDRDPITSRRVGYSLDQINSLRQNFGTSPSRDKNVDKPLILSISNFKGGCSKTTTTVNLANYLASMGYNVLVVDTDSQATATSMFGYIPDSDFTKDDTILPYIDGEKDTLHYAIKGTHYPNIDLIPACLELYYIELEAAVHVAKMESVDEKRDFFKSLRYGLETVSGDYDVVLIDSPPSLGIVSINVLLAADALLVPCACKMYDFTSTVQFFKMINSYIKKLDMEKNYDFIKVVATQYDRREPSQKEFLEVLQANFGSRLLDTPFFNSSEIAKTSAVFSTPFEQPKSNKRIIDNMNLCFRDVEIEIFKTWPSKHEYLARVGKVA